MECICFSLTQIFPTLVIQLNAAMVSFTLISTPGKDFKFKASLISFDNDVKIIADPGWDGSNPDDVLFMEKYLSEIDLILLSHSTPDFIGGYLILCIKFPMLMSSIPVYATLAVSQLGRVSTVEFYRSRGILGPLQGALMEVSDVDEWFDRIVLVKYFQNMTMLENRLLLTAYNSGHSLGGAFWLITKKLDKVVYAPTWNHSKDSFLNSASFLSPTTGSPLPSLVRPTTLITGTDLGSAMSHKKRSEKFIQLVDATLANGGAVLLPTTISGRFFELLHIVDEHLANLQGAAIPVYFLSYSGTRVLNYASNLLDWMSSSLIKEYEGIAAEDRAYSRVPFEPSKVDLLLDSRELVQLPGPKIVFASGLNFGDCEPSTQALRVLCKDEKTTIILTEKTLLSACNTITSELFSEWFKLASSKNNGVAVDGTPVPFEKSFSGAKWCIEEELSGHELAAFKEKVTNSRRQKLLDKVRDKKNKNLLNEDADDSLSSDDENSSDDQSVNQNGADNLPPTLEIDQANNNNALNSHEAFVGDYILQSLDGNKPVDIRISHKLKPRQAMFPFFNSKKRKFDDYGEIIDIKNFQQNDENSANNKLISESKRKFELKDKVNWADHESNTKEGKRLKYGNESSSTDKLTPQEQLNNQLLQKNLDTLFMPVKRVPVMESRFHSSIDLHVRCGLSFVDLSGLVDLRSLNMILSVIRPQNLVLLPDFTNTCDEGALDGRKLLQSSLEKQKLGQNTLKVDTDTSNSSKYNLLSMARQGLSSHHNNEVRVIIVHENEPVNVGSDLHGKYSEFEVTLDNALTSALNWQKLDGNYRISEVRGELAYSNTEHHTDVFNRLVLKSDLGGGTRESKVQKDATNISEKSLGTFGSQLAIGNVRLPELKKKLLSLNLNAEFKGEGTLVVNNEIAIRKVSLGSGQGEDSGDIVIEGVIGKLYYEVKECIKGMLAFV